VLLVEIAHLEIAAQANRALRPLPVKVLHRALRTQNGLRGHSNQSLSATGNSAGKKSNEARDRGGIFGDARRFLATETVQSRVWGSKAAECQRLLRWRQEPVFAQNCVVVSGGPKLRAMHAVPSNQSLRMMFLCFGDLADARINLRAA
jgi:hypothetical protein